MFTFLTPLWLVAVPIVAGAIFFAYLRHGRNKERPIASLFFIKQVAPTAVGGRRKFSLPWRVLFELLVLLALIAALSGMLLKDTSEKAIIVIDNSLSMGAFLNPGDPAVSLLDEAKRSAAANLDLFSTIKSVSVWQSSPEPREISNGFVSASQAKSLISSIQLGFSASGVASVIPRLKSDNSQMMIFSDQLPPPEVQLPTSKVKFIPLNVSNPRRDNVAVEGLALEHSIEENKTQLLVKLKSFMISKASCKVDVSKWDSATWTSLGSREVAFEGYSSKEFLLSLQSSSGNLSGAIRAQITSCSSPKANSLKQDDAGWIVLGQATSKVKLISQFSARELGLDGLAGMQVDSIHPKDWDTAKFSESDALLIFHRFAPKQLPKANVLFVAPPANATLFKLEELPAATKLVRWDNLSPLTRYLTLPDISLKDAVRFVDLPVWGNAVMFSQTGSIAVYGTQTRSRYVALGFEIFPFEGKQNPFLSILTLNIFKWISSSGDQDSSTSLKKISFPQGIESASLLDSIVPGSELFISEDRLSLSTASPALMQITLAGKKQLFAANLFSASESNLLEPSVVALPKAAPTQNEKNGLALEVYLILISLAVLVADSLIFIFRRKRAV